MRLTPEQKAHLDALREESELLALFNLRILELGGEMLPVRTRARNGNEPAWPQRGVVPTPSAGAKKAETTTTTHTPPLTS